MLLCQDHKFKNNMSAQENIIDALNEQVEQKQEQGFSDTFDSLPGKNETKVLDRKELSFNPFDGERFIIWFKQDKDNEYYLLKHHYRYVLEVDGLNGNEQFINACHAVCTNDKDILEYAKSIGKTII